MNIAYGEKYIATAPLRRFRSLLREDFETTSARRFLLYTFVLFPGRRIIARNARRFRRGCFDRFSCIDEMQIHMVNDSLPKSKNLYKHFLNNESLFDYKASVDSFNNTECIAIIKKEFEE